MDKTYLRAYLLSLFMFFFISPFVSLLLPPLLALFIPFILQLMTFAMLQRERDIKVDWRFFWTIFALSSLLLALDSFCFSSFTYEGFNPLLLTYFVLIPIQTLSEEIMFRQLPLKLFNVIDKNWKRALIVLLSASVFCLMHIANPEASDKLFLIYYFVWGLFAVLLTLYAGSIIPTFAFHLANNLFIAVVMNYPDSALPVFSLFLKTETPNLVHAVTFTFFSFLGITLIINFLNQRSQYGKTEKNYQEKEEISN